MLKIDKHTLTYTHNSEYDSHVMFRSAATGFEYNSFFAKAHSNYTWDLEYYLYPAVNDISIHSLIGGEYVMTPFATINVNEFSVINDVGYSVRQLDALVELLRYKQKIVHLDYTKCTTPAYRLSKVYEIFETGCANSLNAYFCVDEFFLVNHPRYFHLKN